MRRTISVTGQGRTSQAPDVAEVRLGVTVTRPTVAEARAAAAATSAAVLEAVTAAGVARADVRTVGLTVQPDYEYADRTPRLRGQSIAHTYLVTVRDLDRLGRVVDGGLAAGATTLDGVSFRAADPAAALTAARLAAFRDARDRAGTLAAEAGLALGEVMSIVEGGLVTPRPMARARMAMAAEAAPTPIEPGTEDVVVSVAVVFRLEPIGEG